MLLIANLIYTRYSGDYILLSNGISSVTGQRSMGIWNLVRRKSMREVRLVKIPVALQLLWKYLQVKSFSLFLSSLSFLDCQSLLYLFLHSKPSPKKGGKKKFQILLDCEIRFSFFFFTFFIPQKFVILNFY